jgi:hypothetical protein
MAPGRGQSRLPVLLLGLLTSALALLGVWAVNQASDEFNIMGFYYVYVIPIGALLVGMAAGSGFGLGSFWTGTRISRGLLGIVVGLLVAAYFAAQYIDYLVLADRHGFDTGFFEYFDLATRQFSFKERHGDGYGDPMGPWGYVFRLLEIGGFVLGGLVVPLALRSKAYCDDCQVYMRSRNLVLVPAGAPVRKIKRKDLQAQEAYAAEQQQAQEDGLQQLELLRQHGAAGRSAEFSAILSKFQERKAVSKLSSRLSLVLEACPVCHQGQLRATQVSGQGNQTRSQDLGRSPLTPGLVRDLRAS